MTEYLTPGADAATDAVWATHEWRVPERYNIAADVCDKHPPEKLAMIWERYDGLRRDVTWGEIQTSANQAAAVLRANGVERGDRVAVVLPPTPETAAVFFGVWKLGALLLSMSVLYGDEGIAHRLSDSTPRVCLEHPAVAEAAAVASPDAVKGQVVKAFIVLSAGHDATDELAGDIQAYVRDHLSLYAYPRKIEFVAELPKTTTGKIRRIELREREAAAYQDGI
jgi:acyl-coenzyme A synthetase/AMP-(fatty) acid ligase